MLRWSIEEERIAGPLNATAPRPVTNRTFTQALARALHRPALVPVPAFALRLLLGEMADTLILQGQCVLPAKASAHGFQFRFDDIDAALRHLYETARGRYLE